MNPHGLPLDPKSSASASSATAAFLSTDNKYIAILTTNELYIYDLGSKNLIHRESDIELSYPDLCTFSSDSKKMACVDIYGEIYLYDLICNSSSYLGGYYDEIANCGDNFQISFILNHYCPIKFGSNTPVYTTFHLNQTFYTLCHPEPHSVILNDPSFILNEVKDLHTQFGV